MLPYALKCGTFLICPNQLSSLKFGTGFLQQCSVNEASCCPKDARHCKKIHPSRTVKITSLYSISCVAFINYCNIIPPYIYKKKLYSGWGRIRSNSSSLRSVQILNRHISAYCRSKKILKP
jgi:hypothetical protein